MIPLLSAFSKHEANKGSDSWGKKVTNLTFYIMWSVYTHPQSPQQITLSKYNTNLILLFLQQEGKCMSDLLRNLF